MSHSKPNNPAITPGDAEDEQPETLAANQNLILKAVMMVLSEACLARFELLITKNQDPSEAAADVIGSLDRYDFLDGLTHSEAHYEDLKKDVERDIGDAAERVIREQNPR